MELSEDQKTEKYGKACGHCNRNTFLPNEYEFFCISCGFNLIKKNMNLLKFNEKKVNFYSIKIC